MSSLFQCRVNKNVCSEGRGKYKGSQALFSSWNWSTASGESRSPILVSKPEGTWCQPHDESGGGLQCFAALDWDVGDTWTWTVRSIPGAPDGYTRVRVIASNKERGIEQEISTVDVAPKLDLASVSAFNENWGGAPSASCLDVPLRRMTIASVGFWNGTQWIGPEYGQAMGGQYDANTTLCQNYSLVARNEGLEISSGGKNIWVDLSKAVTPDPPRFIDPDQARYQWQPLDLSTLKPMR